MSNYIDVEGMRSAAREMNAAADNMKSAAFEMRAVVEHAERLWTNQIAPDMAALMHRLEEINRG